MSIELYSYFRSSCSYRVRIALYFKNIPFTYHPVHLVKSGGEQHTEEFKKINPFSQVPSLKHDGRFLSQSLPILLYLEETFPKPSLLPSSSFEKAQMLSFCEFINSFIQPLQNVSVLNHIEQNLKLDKVEWMEKWMIKGFQSLENFLEETSQDFCYGKKVSCADIFLIPQIYNARRFNLDISAFPKINLIEKNCLELEYFQKALPENQPDAP